MDKFGWEEYLTNSWGQDAKDGKGLDEVVDTERGWSLGFVIGEFCTYSGSVYSKITLLTS